MEINANFSTTRHHCQAEGPMPMRQRTHKPTVYFIPGINGRARCLGGNGEVDERYLRRRFYGLLTSMHFTATNSTKHGRSSTARAFSCMRRYNAEGRQYNQNRLVHSDDECMYQGDEPWDHQIMNSQNRSHYQILPPPGEHSGSSEDDDVLDDDPRMTQSLSSQRCRNRAERRHLDHHHQRHRRNRHGTQEIRGRLAHSDDDCFLRNEKGEQPLIMILQSIRGIEVEDDVRMSQSLLSRRCHHATMISCGSQSASSSAHDRVESWKNMDASPKKSERKNKRRKGKSKSSRKSSKAKSKRVVHKEDLSCDMSTVGTSISSTSRLSSSSSSDDVGFDFSVLSPEEAKFYTLWNRKRDDVFGSLANRLQGEDLKVIKEYDESLQRGIMLSLVSSANSKVKKSTTAKTQAGRAA